MPDASPFELAREKLLQAEKALDDYNYSHGWNVDRWLVLANAATSARDKLLSLLSVGSPAGDGEVVEG